MLVSVKMSLSGEIQRPEKCGPSISYDANIPCSTLLH